MKSFAPKLWFAPSLCIGTYNKDGVANAMNAAWAGQWGRKSRHGKDGADCLRPYSSRLYPAGRESRKRFLRRQGFEIIEHEFSRNIFSNRHINGM